MIIVFTNLIHRKVIIKIHFRDGSTIYFYSRVEWAVSEARIDLKNNFTTYDDNQKKALENVIKQKSDENNRIWNDSAQAWKQGQIDKIKQDIDKQVAAVENIDGINALVIKNDTDLNKAKQRLIDLEKQGRLGGNKTAESVLEEIKKDKGKNLQYFDNNRLVTEVFINQQKEINPPYWLMYATSNHLGNVLRYYSNF